MSSGVPTVDDHFQNHCSGHKCRHPPANPSNKVNSSCVEVCLTCVMPGGATKSRGEGCGRRKRRGHQCNPCTPNVVEKNHQKEQLSDSCIHATKPRRELTLCAVSFDKRACCWGCTSCPVHPGRGRPTLELAPCPVLARLEQAT